MVIEYIFFYGTLMCPEVYTAVTGQDLVASVGSLNGYEIFSLKNRVYPGVKSAPNASVTGLVTKVERPTLDKLDWFEGSEYERKVVEVSLGSGEVIRCFSYILKDTQHHIIDHKEWDFQYFLEVNLEGYLD